MLEVWDGDRKFTDVVVPTVIPELVELLGTPGVCF